MTKILRIAKTELRVLFYSPIAWLLLVIFAIQAGLFYTDLLYSQETSQQLERPLNVLSKVLFAGEKGLFSAIQGTLYLYIPLLTMGLLSREISSGSIKLLLSSPLKMREIVLGKFLSMVIYALLLVFILSLYVISAYFSITELDISFVLGGLLGLFLLICAYAAIGIFMSSLTAYQLVAAISTLAVLAALNYISEIGNNFDIIRDITNWLSLSGRTDNFVNGLIISRDVIYFILFVGLFLSLTIYKLNNQQRTISIGKKLLQYGILFGTFFFVGYLSSLPKLTVYYDTTRFNDRTLTKKTQELIKGINDPLKITNYVNVAHYTASYGAPKNRINDKKRFESYQRFLPDMQMDYVVYYDSTSYIPDSTLTLEQQARNASQALGFNFKKILSPAQIRTKINLLPEGNRFVRMVNVNGKTTALRMFDDIISYPGESEINAAIKRLLYRPAKVGFITGEAERDVNKIGDRDYKAITTNLGTRNALINQGFEVLELNLDTIDQIPPIISTLVIADPRKAYSPNALEKISEYLRNGGNAIIAGEPGRQAILNPILEEMELQFSAGTLLQDSDNYDLDLLQALFTNKADSFGFRFYDNAIVTMPEAMGIKLKSKTNFKVTPLLVTNPATVWNKTESFDLATEKIAFDPETETRISTPVLVALTRKINRKEQKIIVAGDADFISNVEVTRFSPNNVNSSFVIRMFGWMTDGEYPVNYSRPKSIDTKILVSRKQINMQKLLFLGILPILMATLGGITLYRRKRY